MAHPLRGKSAIVGLGLFGLGEAPGWSAWEIMARAAAAALADAGLRMGEVDGLFCAMMEDSMPAVMAAEYLGIRPRFVDGTMTGGSSFVGYLASATAALDAGLCDVALVCYGSNQRTAAGRLVTASRPPRFEAPYAPRYPITAYALAASRHMHEYGTTREQLADVAVAARLWARANPEAFVREPLTREDVLASRMVNDPLTVLDCCLVTDGGGALVLVRADRAGDGPQPPAYVLASAAESAHRQIGQMPDLTVTAARESGARAYAMAGVRPSEIDVAELYDAFTINTVLFLEDLGFCAKGEGGAFVADGNIAPGGSLPVNTNGGGLSCTHPGMYGIFPVIEAVRQIRGTAPGHPDRGGGSGAGPRQRRRAVEPGHRDPRLGGDALTAGGGEGRMVGGQLFDAEKFVRDLFRPRSFAVLGASDDPTRIGGRPLAYTKQRFKGPIYPVNPKREAVQGLRAYPSVGDIEGEVDFALIALPAPMVEGAVRDCAAKGVRCCLIFSSGFAEVGGEGAIMQARLAAIARETGIRILGPNCLGAFDAGHGFFPTFTSTLESGLPEAGHVGVVCQSGAYGSHIYMLLRRRRIGVGRLLTTGNESDVSVAEGIHALARDGETGCILAYAEGLKDGPAFRHALETARLARVPVAMMKVGRSAVGAAAAASHTASLAGEDAVFGAVLRQHGAHRARATEELIDIAYATRRRIYPAGRKLGVVTISGGAGVLMADAAEDHGLDLTPMPEAAQRSLKAALPFASAVNPVDITAQAFNDIGLIRTNMDLMLREGGYDSILAFFTSVAGARTIAGPLRAALLEAMQGHEDRLVALSILASDEVVAGYEADGFPVFEDPTRAVAALAALTRFGEAFARPAEPAAPPLVSPPPPLPPGPMSEADAKALLARAGVPVLEERLAASPDEAAEAAGALGFPVALKIVSPQIAHKTEIGGVALGLADAGAVREAARGILARAAAAHPEARIDGLLVAPMAGKGIEVILGVQNDPVFGPTVMFGLGGIFAEVMRDVTFRVAPFGRDEARRMIDEIKGRAVLDGVRGRPAGDVEALAETLAALSRFAAAHAESLETCDVNPFLVRPPGRGGVALDAVLVGRGA